METMTVTAAMPMTTPRTVSPDRSLFFPSCRKDRTTRSTTFTAGPLEPGHQSLPGLQVPRDQFRELSVHEANGDRHGHHLVPVGHPHHALVLRPRLLGPSLGRELFLRLLRVLLLGL